MTAVVDFIPNTIPTSGTEFTIAYTEQTANQEVLNLTADAFGVLSFTLANVPIDPGSLVITTNVKIPNSASDFVGPVVVDTDKAIVVTDNGAGAWNNGYAGTVNYSTGVVVLNVAKQVVAKTITGSSDMSSYGPLGSSTTVGGSKTVVTTGPVTPTFPAGSTVTVRYIKTSNATFGKTKSVTLTELRIDLSTATAEPLIAGSIRFSFAGDTFIDRAGILYRNHSALTGTATASGTINYETGIATLTQWTAGSPTLTIHSAASIKGLAYVVGVNGRTPGAPLSTGQFQLVFTDHEGNSLTASADNNGVINTSKCQGTVDWETGVFKLGFGSKQLDSSLSANVKANSGWYDAANVDGTGHIWVPLPVKPETITFNAVLISYIPLDADLLGVDTVRLPQDGRVPLFRPGNVAVIHNTQTLTLPNSLTAGSTHNIGRTLLSYAKLFDANGLVVPTTKYTTNLDAGTVTMATPLDLTGYVQPLVCEHRIEDMSLVTDVQITGQVTLMKPVRHAYAANTSFLSSALVIGDMQARVANVFDQQTWTNVYQDTLIGSVASASFNDVLYPIAVTNEGAIQERWAIIFTGATAFSCYGEYSGLVAQGNTGADFAPLNPITNQPYFAIDHLGWGIGWSTGSVLRFNTIGANYPVWLARTTLQSDPQVYTDNFKLQIRGDAN